jgi:nicotinamide-nucleotide amidase
VIDAAILAQAEALVERCWDRRVMLATAESCTGGLVAAAITAIAGSSQVLDRGFVTYTNAAKHDMVGVALEMIAAEGAVSEAVARAMAEGALRHSQAGLAVSVTGLAGPGGGTADKPVGLVWIGCAMTGAETHVARHVFPGDRTAIRRAAVAAALEMLLARL